MDYASVCFIIKTPLLRFFVRLMWCSSLLDRLSNPDAVGISRTDGVYLRIIKQLSFIVLCDIIHV